MDVLLTVAGLLLFLLLTFGTGVAVAAEFSLTALERSAVEANVKQVGDRRSKTLLAAHRSLSFQLSGAQIAITLTTLISGFLAEPIIGELLQPLLAGIGMPDAAARATSLTLAVLIATALSMIFGELVPKNLAIARPLPTARAVIGYHARFSAVFGWLIRAMNDSANWVVRKFGVEPQEELRSARSPQELESIVRSAAESGTLDTVTATLLDRSLRFGDRTADELMTPRTQVEFLREDSTVQELVELSARTGLSRFPVCGEDLDDIAGAIHVKQAFTVPAEQRKHVRASSLMRPVPTVPESLPGDALLNRLRDASCSDLGHPRLDRAAEAFQDDWEDGIDEIGDLTGDIVEGLRKAIRVYRELDESIRDTFGGGQQGYVAGAGPDPGDSIIARRLEGE